MQHIPAALKFPGSPVKALAVGSGSQVGRAVEISTSNWGAIACTGWRSRGSRWESECPVWRFLALVLRKAFSFSVLVYLVHALLKFWLLGSCCTDARAEVKGCFWNICIVWVVEARWKLQGLPWVPYSGSWCLVEVKPLFFLLLEVEPSGIWISCFE